MRRPATGMISAGKCDTDQLPYLANTPQERRNAAVTCRAHIRRTGGTPDDLLELLRELGLADDPHALRRDPLAQTTGRYLPREAAQ